MSQLSKFTETNKCRCGYWTGVHRCHAGRPDPNGTGEDGSRHCEKPAICKLVVYPICIPGVQFKMGAVESFYCVEHTREVLGIEP